MPIVADETRTFGMEGLFRQIGIYSPVGQLYKPQDAAQLMYYREAKDGQILQEGISEAGALCSWIAAATSYSTSNEPMIPFFIFYSMFGFQRIGDLIWASGDMRSRGFLIGGTSGRTTLNGEGLQHEDGQSQIMRVVHPELRFVRSDVRVRGRGHRAGRLASHDRRARGRLLLHHGDERELHASRNAERRAKKASCKGMYLLRDGGATAKSPRVQLLGSGTILREVLAGGRRCSQNDFGVRPTSGARRASISCGATGSMPQRWNLLHPDKNRRAARSWSSRWARRPGPVVAATRLYENVRRQIGRSSATALPRARHRRLRAQRLPARSCATSSKSTGIASRWRRSRALADDGTIAASRVAEAIEKYSKSIRTNRIR